MDTIYFTGNFLKVIVEIGVSQNFAKFGGKAHKISGKDGEEKWSNAPFRSHPSKKKLKKGKKLPKFVSSYLQNLTRNLQFVNGYRLI